MSQSNFWDEQSSPSVKPESPAEVAGDLSPIVDLFDKAGELLKWPKVRFGKMILVRTRDNTVLVKMGPRDSRGVIERDGELRLRNSSSLSPNLQKFLRVFAANPVKFASLEGIRTGTCCFCARELTTPESVTVGYGPVCAQKWCLPWGHRKFDNEPVKLDELEGSDGS